MKKYNLYTVVFTDGSIFHCYGTCKKSALDLVYSLFMRSVEAIIEN